MNQQARRDEGQELLNRAIADGQLRADVPVELALDLIYGPIFYRLTMGHARVDARFADRLLSGLIEGLGS